MTPDRDDLMQRAVLQVAAARELLENALGMLARLAAEGTDAEHAGDALPSVGDAARTHPRAVPAPREKRPPTFFGTKDTKDTKDTKGTAPAAPASPSQSVGA